jgi:hypothetical protein
MRIALGHTPLQRVLRFALQTGLQIPVVKCKVWQWFAFGSGVLFHHRNGLRVQSVVVQDPSKPERKQKQSGITNPKSYKSQI